ncbi:MAG TPA: type I secretion system permease/ATPase [Burkholderiaceae bacterium]|nr:type I secretion system permease/ATPase [Burkholderiaceae bacterium]
MTAFLRAHARFFLAAGLFSLVINLVLLAPSLYMLQVFDRVLATRSVETLVMLSLITGGALLLMFALDLVRGRLLALLGALFERTVGRRTLQQVLGEVSTPAAATHQHALRDVGVLRAFLSGPGIVALFDAPWMPVYLVVIALFSPLLGLLGLASAAVLLLLTWINERTTRAGLEQAQQQMRAAGQFVDGVMRNTEVVHALGMAPAVAERWEAQSGQLQLGQLGLQRIAGLVGSATRFFRQSVQVAMMAAAAWLVIQQQASAGVMIAVTIILGRALAPVEQLVAQWKALVEARVAWQRLSALLGRGNAPRFAALPDPSGAITIEGLTYVPPGAQKPVLRQVSVEIAAGEVLALIGPSGSGKSTLARLLLGVLAPSAGVVRLDGAALSQWDPDRLGRHLGYLPQDVNLFAGTIADNIARLGNAHSEQVVLAAQRAQVHDLIVRLPKGYDTPVGEAGRWLSGGQCQRVGLARAFFGDPRIVVLDEPNAHLDKDGEQALALAIAQARARGTTVVLITQRTQILSVADRIMVMRDGMVERIGVRQDKAVEAAGPEPAANVPVLHSARAQGAA